MTFERFEIPGFRGEVATRHAPRDLAASVETLIDPGRARDTIHWARNYLYGAVLETVDGPLDVVVKQFRNQGLKARWRRRVQGSKAEKHWRIAGVLAEAGVPTPAPVMLIESDDPEGPSFLVTRRLDDAVELRYYLRAVNAGRQESEYPGIPLDDLLEALGRSIARVHEAGVWHRDVSVGNLMIREGDERPSVWWLDLNRARRLDRLGVVRRTRDLCRLRIFGARSQRRFLDAYWGEGTRLATLKRSLYWLFHKTFLWRHEAKNLLRAPFRGLRPRTAHAHIPAAPAGASARDRIVWDRLSDQPHQHASRWGKLRVRLADAGAHVGAGAAFLGAAPRVWLRYRRLARERYRSPVAWRGAGVAVRPRPEDPRALLEAVEELGVRRLYLRLDTWSEEAREAEEALARDLHERGYELAFGVPQDRDLVRDPARWDAAVAEIARRFTPFGRDFQIGQAVNRSKWGVWTYEEYFGLLRAAARRLRAARDDVRLLGPAVIDFELYATAAIVNMRSGAPLDALSSLLYVDRRGAPENPQLGFDTVDKVTLLKAIAETARNCGPGSWITEVNWPLREGPHAPAGRSVAVDEETQADYLVRFYLLALCTGLVERVYWWQLVSRGYGLVCPETDGTLRRRPAFAALRTLEARLAGATFLGPAEGTPEGAHAYRFTLAGGTERWAVWAEDGEAEIGLPSPARSAVDRDGSPLDLDGRRSVEASGSLVWLDLGAPDRE